MPGSTLKLPPKKSGTAPEKRRSGTVRPIFGAKPAKAAGPKPEATVAPAARRDSGRGSTDGANRTDPVDKRRPDRDPSKRTGVPKARADASPAATLPRDTPQPRRRSRADAVALPTAPGVESARPQTDTATAKQRFYAGAVAPPPTRHRAQHHKADPAPGAAAGGEALRLSKLMSERGLCSRREADEWIANGWVHVDGEVVDRLGTRVLPTARIEVDPLATRQQGESVTILLHKPVGYVSGQPEEEHKPAVTLIRGGNRWQEDGAPLEFRPAHLRGLAPAGRLDIDSTGLLVFTQDGRIARILIGEDSTVEKEYLVRVEGTLTPQALRLLNHGLALDGAKLKPAKVSWQNEDQLRFVLREGKKRQIRRMCELVGLTVTGLKRIRIGSVSLGKLPLGKWRYLRRDERF
jgi:23S rRNA pseudouridine2604 synthase